MGFELEKVVRKEGGGNDEKEMEHTSRGDAEPGRSDWSARMNRRPNCAKYGTIRGQIWLLRRLHIPRMNARAVGAVEGGEGEQKEGQEGQARQRGLLRDDREVQVGHLTLIWVPVFSVPGVRPVVLLSFWAGPRNPRSLLLLSPSPASHLVHAQDPRTLSPKTHLPSQPARACPLPHSHHVQRRRRRRRSSSRRPRSPDRLARQPHPTAQDRQAAHRDRAC